MVSRRLWVGALFAVALLLTVRSASATPIVVNGPETLTFNFDFVASGAVPLLYGGDGQLGHRRVDGF